MNRILAIAAATVAFAAPAFAQTTTAEVVGGASGNAAYPIEVIGANGVQYFCRPNGTSTTGAAVYACIRPGAGGGLALNNGALIGAGAAALLAAVVISADDSTAGEED